MLVGQLRDIGRGCLLRLEIGVARRQGQVLDRSRVQFRLDPLGARGAEIKRIEKPR